MIVDEQEDLVEFYKTWLEPEELELQFAHSGVDALNIIDTYSFDLALIDLSLSDMNGLDILHRMRDDNLDIPAIISSTDGAVSMSQVTKALQMGKVTFIEKPYVSESLQENIHVALEQYSGGLVQGNLLDLSLTSLISLSCNEGKTARLDIQHQGQEATLFFAKGQITHALLNDVVGDEAVYETLTWDEGDFIMRMGLTASERTIQANWSGLVLEGLRRLDESTFDQEQLEPVDEFNSHNPSKLNQSSSFGLDDHTQTKVENIISQLDTQAVSHCILFLTRGGHLLHSRAQTAQSKVPSLAALVAGSFSATDQAAQILTPEISLHPQCQQSLQEGPSYGLYSAGVGSNWILTMAFDPQITNLGLARQVTLKAAAKLDKILTQAEDMTKQQEQIIKGANENFHQDVDDVLDDLFDL